jgi:hypothetical protein
VDRVLVLECLLRRMGRERDLSGRLGRRRHGSQNIGKAAGVKPRSRGVVRPVAQGFTRDAGAGEAEWGCWEFGRSWLLLVGSPFTCSLDRGMLSLLTGRWLMRRRDFLLLATLAAASVTAFGQAVTPAVGPTGSGAQSAASIPDFSGIWSHPYWPGFEPPASGPGPVTNRLRLRGGPQRGVSDPRQLVGDYANPILKPEAAEFVKKHGEMELSGVGAPTPTNQCWPEPLPYIFWTIVMRMLQQPDRIIILSGNQVRHVRMNEPHPARVTPSLYGDSVGRYEGDTLVVDTVGIRTDRPFAMVDMYGTPFTEKLHVVERYRLLDYEDAKEGLERNAKENFRLPPDTIPPVADSDPNYRGKHLQLTFTVEDKGVFTTPWSATITYGRPPARDGRGPGGAEYVCAENPRYSGRKPAVPTADKPDF